MDERPETSETTESAAERYQRWADEAAEAGGADRTGPGSRFADLVGDYLPRVLGATFLLLALAGITFVALDVAHRGPGGEGGTKDAGWVTAATCFDEDPSRYFTGTESLLTLPTADCEDAHLAEAFLSFDPATLPVQSGTAQECQAAWAEQSDVPLDVSGVELTVMVKSPVDQPGPEVAVCVAVGPESVTGRRLASWQPESSS